jgi:hypothetical protein
MYADDIILVSTSAPGLQEKNRYSWQILWWLVSTVNTQKTKIMVSNNAGRLSNVQFKLNNTVLECVHRYKYLGLTFYSSGSFMYAQEELYNKHISNCQKTSFHTGSEDFSKYLGSSFINILNKLV